MQFTLNPRAQQLSGGLGCAPTLLFSLNTYRLLVTKMAFKDIQMFTRAEDANFHFNVSSSEAGCFSPCWGTVIITVLLQEPC